MIVKCKRRWLPRKYGAINICGLIFVSPGVRLSPTLINHERIHTRQMLELLIVPFYLIYIIEWIVRLPMKGNAYYNLSFEREAYRNMNNLSYLKHRRPFAWIKYLRK